MEPLSRRTVLVLGAVGAVAVVGGGAVLWNQTRAGAPAPPPTPASPTESSAAESAGSLHEPDELWSTGGRLDLTLTAASAGVVVGGAQVRALTYNGSLPGPTLRVRAGDRIALAFRNELDAPTNLHTHGMVVSPEGNGDNPFLAIEPGTAFAYDIRLGADHPPGVFWYHPHHHGNAADQLFGGLYGAIVVDDELPIESTRERLLMISDIAFDSAGDIRAASPMDRMLGREGDVVMVNGQVGATLQAHPGDLERWRVINACSSRFLRLRLDGQRLMLLGVDSGRYPEPRELDEIDLAPGNRADLMVTAVEGDSVLRTLPFDRGQVGGMGRMQGSTSASAAVDLLTVTVSGAPNTVRTATPVRAAQRDLRLERTTARRTLTLAMGGMAGMGMGAGMAFTIDGKEYDHARIDTEIAHGAIEEWTLVNTSTMDHPFHLHVWPMQLIEVGGVPITATEWRDVVMVPARSRAVVRIAFAGLTGRTVYHCHILDHEDNGMMGVIHTA